MEEIVIIGVIVEAIQKVYATYQQAYNLLVGPGPNVEAQIVEQLQVMANQITAIQDQIKALTNDVAALLAAVLQIAINDTAAAVATQQAYADTAREEFSQWVEGGETDSLLIENAKDHSLLAANAMRDTKEFFRLVQANQAQGIASDVFDYRLALVQYVYVLSVRLTIVMVTDPSWRTDPVISEELQLHADRFNDIILGMETAIQLQQDPGLYPIAQEGSQYRVYAFTEDTVSSYVTNTVDATVGTEADAEAFLALVKTAQFAEVRNAIGLTTVMHFQATLAWYAKGAPTVGTWTPWSVVTPSIGPDFAADEGFLFPLTAASGQPHGLSLFWVTGEAQRLKSPVQHAIDSRVSDPTTGWGPVATVIAPGLVGSAALIPNPLGATVVQAVSSLPGSMSLVWTTPDGSIQSSYCDARATSASWAQPFYVVQDPDPGSVAYVVAKNLLAVVSAGPGQVRVFWLDAFTRDIMTSAFALTVEPAGSENVVVASAPSEPVAIGKGRLPDHGFAAVSGGTGSVSAFWFSEAGLESTYYDERATVPEWAAPFIVAPGATIWSGGLAAVSTAPYSVDIFWAPEPQDGYVSILTSAYSLQTHQVKPTKGGGFLVEVSPSAPTPPMKIAASGSVNSSGPGISAVATAPINLFDGVGGAGPGAASVFWLTQDQHVQSTYRADADSAWSVPELIGAPIGESSSPIVPVATATGEISLFVHRTDGSIYWARYRPGDIRPLPLVF